jgi:hypothetical protein
MNLGKKNTNFWDTKKSSGFEEFEKFLKNILV